MFRLLSCALLALPLLIEPALAQRPAGAPGNGDAAGQEMMNGMSKMNHDMSVAPMSGDPDHDFVAMMIPHHQGAIDMAQTELRYGKDAVIRHLAREVIAAQKKEIELMQRWQASHVSH
jgi:uncharacterized protein (DUF305 family)